MKKKERNNSGFTLVELLIAIAILMIIAVPFMRSFVTAARTNAKAQQIQNATLLATNIMEEVKANTMEDLAFQFNYPERDDNTSRFDVMSSYTAAYELRSSDGELQNVTKYLENGNANNREYVTSSVLYKTYRTNLEDDYEFLGQELGRYYFVMEGLQAGATEYDALITMNANGYKTVDDKGYNDKPIVEIEPLDVLEDAFHVQDADQDAYYAEQIADAANIEDVNTVLNGMTRKITVDIEKENNLIRAHITFEYKYGSYTRAVSNMIYNNSEAQENSLKNIYLFYVPSYTSNVDEIVINNNDNVDATIYIVKQRNGSMNDALLQTKESTYRCRVSVYENESGFQFSTHRAHLKVRSNLGTNLYNGAPVAGQVSYKYTGANNQSQENTTYVKKVLGLNTLDGSTEKDRIYEVTVEIYKKGEAAAKFAGEPVAKITGSKDN